MHDESTRVVFENRPYLLVEQTDGTERAYGPFDPGTEPALSMCGPDTEIHDPELLRLLRDLRSRSPELPAHSDTLAAS